jgi:hypothetical protein
LVGIENLRLAELRQRLLERRQTETKRPSCSTAATQAPRDAEKMNIGLKICTSPLISNSLLPNVPACVVAETVSMLSSMELRYFHNDVIEVMK